jgi:hypothetical protein
VFNQNRLEYLNLNDTENLMFIIDLNDSYLKREHERTVNVCHYSVQGVISFRL